MDQDQIDQAAETCLKYVSDKDRPFQHVADFMLMLKTGGWTEDALIAVQNRVLRGLTGPKNGSNT